MNFLVMQNFCGLIVFVWLVPILTLSTSDDIKVDGNVSLSSTLNAHFIDGNSKVEHQTLSSIVRSRFQPVNSSKTFNKNVASPSVAGEGGPISIISPNQQASSSTFHLNTPNNLDTHANLSKEEENIAHEERRKNTSKIVSRKGANEMPDIKSESNLSAEITLSNDRKSIVESSAIANAIHNNEHANNYANISKLNITDQHIDMTLNTTVKNSLHSINVLKLSTSAPFVTASMIQEHKPKPTATIIEPNSDKHAFIQHSNGPRLGMPKKIDYVLPVIVTLIALPVLGAIIFMVYKQVRDYWDKRHYRRMDFLIDGMYND